MNLKQALLAALDKDQLKTLCEVFGFEADRRSADAMLAALKSAKRAKPEEIIEHLDVAQLRAVLAEADEPTEGKKAELVQRLLVAGGRGDSSSATRLTAEEAPAGYQAIRQATGGSSSDVAGEYRHADQAVQRPDAGVQDQFQARRPPRTYRYDSSLDPALSWDEQRERDLGEWLLGLVIRAAKEGEKTIFAEAQEWKGGGVRIASLADAAQMLQQIGKPFLNWAGKAERHEIKVPTAPLFVHERHSTKAILDGIRHRKARGQTLDLFGDAGMDIRENLEAYEHKGPWQNRMILGDSLSVMNSLLEFEGMAGQVQMIYIDPPYGVKFGSNFQPFVRKRDVKPSGDEDMTREPEMVKAYRDTWELGLHSYLTYLRDRLMSAKELLHESGSVFVQISEENVHHVREVMDEVFGVQNFISLVTFRKKLMPLGGKTLESMADFLVWYARDSERIKYRQLYRKTTPDPKGRWTGVAEADGTLRRLTTDERSDFSSIPPDCRIFGTVSQWAPSFSPMNVYSFEYQGKTYDPTQGQCWVTSKEKMNKLGAAGRLFVEGRFPRYVVFHDDFPFAKVTNPWDDTAPDLAPEKRIS